MNKCRLLNSEICLPFVITRSWKDPQQAVNATLIKHGFELAEKYEPNMKAPLRTAIGFVRLTIFVINNTRYFDRNPLKFQKTNQISEWTTGKTKSLLEKVSKRLLGEAQFSDVYPGKSQSSRIHILSNSPTNANWTSQYLVIDSKKMKKNIIFIEKETK
jgi:hypothetical protein